MLFRRQSHDGSPWVALAQEGNVLHAAQVCHEADAMPRLSWLWRSTGTDQKSSLRALSRVHPLASLPLLGVLDRPHYSLHATEAPADLPREQWADAVRWVIKDQLDFPVDDALIDVLAVPQDTQLRQNSQVMAVIVPRASYTPAELAVDDLGLRWEALDVPETALRNLSALAETEGQAHALMVFGEHYGLLVITFQGELLMTRHIEVQMAALGGDADMRGAALSRASLEILRTIDSFERMHSQVALSGLSVALPPGCGPEVLAMLAELVYVPLKAFDLSAWLDVSALGDDAARVATACTLNELCAIGGALRPRMQATGRQQLQLLDPHSALMSPGSWHARLAVKLAAGMLALCAVAAVALSVMTAYYTRQAMSLEDDLTKLRVSVTSVPKAAIIQEVEVLKQKEARQRQLRDTLQSTVAAASLGYSDFLLALGRQTSGSLWITRLSVRGDGQDLELSGRMTNPAALPAYLQQLEREDRFRGRRFAQIDMRALPADAHLPDGVVQFTLSGREAAERGTKEAKP